MIEPTKITVGSKEFSLGRLDLFQSLNVSRLVAPILPVLFGTVLSKIAQLMESSKESAGSNSEQKLNEIALLITTSQPCLQVIAQMPREDFETIIRTCLSACEIRNESGGWSKIVSNGQLIRQDITQSEALVLTVRVITRELKPFMSAVGL